MRFLLVLTLVVFNTFTGQVKAEESTPELDALIVKALSYDRNALTKITEVEEKNLKTTVLHLLKISEQGIYLSQNKAGYEFVTCWNRNLYYGYGYYGAYHGTGVKELLDEQKSTVDTSKEISRGLLVSMGQRSTDILIETYKSGRNRKSTLDILEQIADRALSSEKDRDKATKLREKIYSFISEVYTNKAKNAHKEFLY